MVHLYYQYIYTIINLCHFYRTIFGSRCPDIRSTPHASILLQGICVSQQACPDQEWTSTLVSDNKMDTRLSPVGISEKCLQNTCIPSMLFHLKVKFVKMANRLLVQCTHQINTKRYHSLYIYVYFKTDLNKISLEMWMESVRLLFSKENMYMFVSSFFSFETQYKYDSYSHAEKNGRNFYSRSGQLLVNLS